MTADLNRRLENIIRFGTIAEVDLTNAKAKVQSGGILTDWLTWVSLRAGTTRTWSPPTVGEQCIVLAASGELTTATVLYGIYTQAHNAPSQNADEHIIEFADGAKIIYNQQSHNLTVSRIATALIQTSTKITLDTPLVECTQNLTVGGNVQVGGTVKSAGDQIAGSISQINHIHGGSPKPS